MKNTQKDAVDIVKVKLSDSLGDSSKVRMRVSGLSARPQHLFRLQTLPRALCFRAAECVLPFPCVYYLRIVADTVPRNAYLGVHVAHPGFVRLHRNSIPYTDVKTSA